MRQPLMIEGATLAAYLTDDRTCLDPHLAPHVATWRAWRDLRAITHPPAATFADLDPRSQTIYQAIAAAFPDHAVYATGSRTRGTWRSGHPTDPKTALAQRLGKSLESDVDVVVAEVSHKTFRETVAPLALAFGVRIDRQPATITPRVAIPITPITPITGTHL